MSRADWQRKLPKTLTIPGVGTLKTLADARKLLRHLPEDHRDNQVWRHTAAELVAAAEGGNVEEAWVALRMALMIGRVEHRIERTKKAR